ncbi:Hypothetical predicted protein [Olea europaea subsp. europaea]|uniref:Uncharacterized protein n=1 Tax=Olea europaea subsp. europaea TaxID=158383 RepID=A0A8S0RFB4_OLEEU|nr:Hypothetical predicted protein [Olea europaea subsp. europaea]
MEDYNKRQRTGQIINGAVPVQQFHPMADEGLMDLNMNVQIEGSEKVDKDSEMGPSFQVSSEIKNVNINISSNEAQVPHAGRDVFGCEDYIPVHGQIIKNAVPMQQIPPMLDAGLMDLGKNVQLKCSASNFFQQETADEGLMDLDEEMGHLFKQQWRLKNVNIKISPNEAFDLQIGLDMIGCKDNNPVHGQVVYSAVPVQLFHPMADEGLMGLRYECSN